MKRSIIILLFMQYCFVVNAQKDFIGIAKYRITVVGAQHSKTDSMAVIFGKQKIKVIFYLPGTKDPEIPDEMSFIDDFSSHTTLSIDQNSKTYKISDSKTNVAYEFINTNKFDANRNFLCLRYKADPLKIDTSSISGAECLCSIDFGSTVVKNHFFLGVQPIIVDNRLVMDFTVTQKDGLKPRIYLYDIAKMDDTEQYFSLEGLTKAK